MLPLLDKIVSLVHGGASSQDTNVARKKAHQTVGNAMILCVTHVVGSQSILTRALRAVPTRKGTTTSSARIVSRDTVLL